MFVCFIENNNILWPLFFYYSQRRTVEFIDKKILYLNHLIHELVQPQQKIKKRARELRAVFVRLKFVLTSLDYITA